MQQWTKKFLAVSIAMLVWGNPVFANTNPIASLSEDVDKISTWTTYLNTTYPSLDLAVAVTVSNENVSRSVLREINQLKDVLQGTRNFPAGAFTTLACIRPECGVVGH